MRRLMLSLSVLSLLVALVLIVACVRGRWAADWFEWAVLNQNTNTWREATLVVGSDGLYFSWQRFDFENLGNALKYAGLLNRAGGFGHFTSQRQWNPFAGGSFWNRLGFGWINERHENLTADDGLYSYTFNRGHFPYWLLILASLTGGTPASVAWVKHRRRSRWARQKRCRHCGYDLRATPERCPECGASVNAR